MDEASSAQVNVHNLKSILRGDILPISYLPFAGLFLFGYPKILTGSSIPMLEKLVFSFILQILRFAVVSFPVQQCSGRSISGGIFRAGGWFRGMAIVSFACIYLSLLHVHLCVPTLHLSSSECDGSAC